MNVDPNQRVTLESSDGQIIPLRIEINRRARRLILRLDEQRTEAVAVAPSPRHIKEAVAFAKTRIDWLATALSKLPKPVHVKDGSEIYLRGDACRITATGSGRSPILEAGPPRLLRLPGDPETIGRRALRYLKATARRDLERAVNEYCDKLDLQPHTVSIKDTRSRWGSCTSTGKLSFSWRLIMAPTDVLDYVAAHECAHLIEMNHSPAFWSIVEACKPDWRAARTWLHRNGSALHAVKLG